MIVITHTGCATKRQPIVETKATVSKVVLCPESQVRLPPHHQRKSEEHELHEVAFTEVPDADVGRFQLLYAIDVCEHLLSNQSVNYPECRCTAGESRPKGFHYRDIIFRALPNGGTIWSYKRTKKKSKAYWREYKIYLRHPNTLTCPSNGA